MSTLRDEYLKRLVEKGMNEFAAKFKVGRMTDKEIEDEYKFEESLASDAAFLDEMTRG